jgi:hypothetical protein
LHQCMTVALFSRMRSLFVFRTRLAHFCGHWQS